MAEKSRLFDDLAGVAGGAFSVLVGVRDEAEGALKARLDELVRRLDVATNADLEAVKELSANARSASEEASQRLEALAQRLDAIERRLGALEQKSGGETETMPRPDA